jgi:2-dehydrotetronate isomerase
MINANAEWVAASVPWVRRGADPFQSYATVRTMGFDAIEHPFPYDLQPNEVLELLKRHRLQMALIYAPPRYREGERGLACIPGREEEFKRGIKTALDYANRLDCRLMGVLAGDVPPNADRNVCLDTLVDNLRFAADAVRRDGIQIIVEPICRQRAPDFILHTLDEAAEVLSRVQSPTVRLCFDTFHVAMERGSVVQEFDSHREMIGYVQIANTPSRTGPSEGDLDLAFFVDHALKSGWQSWISCEYMHKPGSREESFLSWASGFYAEGRLTKVS